MEGRWRPRHVYWDVVEKRVSMLPLLHAAQSAAELTAVDRSVISSAGAGMATVLVAAWRPRRLGKINPFKSSVARRRILGWVAGVSLFVALVPMVAPLDHILVPHADAQAHQDVHTAHCHGSPGSCSDLPLVSGPGQFMLNEPLIVVPALLATLLVASVAILRGLSFKPEVRPPMRRTAAI